MANEHVLVMEGIIKDYFGTRVLKGVDIKVKAGEIHALLGENGAGKSTLMNILFGMPVIHSTGGFEGKVVLDGKVAQLKSPKEAMESGIGMVHQEFMLIPGFTISENVKLNREITKDNVFSTVFRSDALKSLDRKTMDQDARKALDTLGMDIDEWVKIAGLPIGHMQFVEIAREIDKKGIKLLVFDEPTAVLTESEAENLIAAMKRLAATGIAIMFITHRLDEVMMASDRITILRDGELVRTLDTKDTNVADIAEMMVGRKIEVLAKTEESINTHLDDAIILDIKDLRVSMPGEAVKGVSFEIKKGEIIGLGGLAGQGKIGISNGILGMFPSTGEVLFEGKPFKLNDTQAALISGMAFVSEDRRGVGLLLDSSIEDNICFTTMQTKNDFLHQFGPIKLSNTRKIKSHAVKMIKDLDIRCTGPLMKTRKLSGGNQQKVCLARSLTLDPKVLFVSEPTRGIDIGAKKLVLDLLIKLNKEQGMTIVMTSSELAELRSVCDRIAIICEGRVEGILKPTDSDKDFGLMMSGDYHKYYAKEAKTNGKD